MLSEKSDRARLDHASRDEVIGTRLKVDGNTWNPVDPARVEAFMKEVRRARGE